MSQQVQVPQDCIDLAADVNQPALPRDPNLATVRTSAALATARGNLKATRECQHNQRTLYGATQ